MSRLGGPREDPVLSEIKKISVRVGAQVIEVRDSDVRVSRCGDRSALCAILSEQDPEIGADILDDAGEIQDRGFVDSAFPTLALDDPPVVDPKERKVTRTSRS